MKKLKRLAAPMLLSLLAASSAFALEECRDPTPDERFQMDLCAAHAGCAIDISLMDACASVTRRIKNFFANQRPELESGESDSARERELSPSDSEQARKDAELYRANRYLEDRESRQTFNELTVLDRSIKERIARNCGTPMDQGCQNAVSDVGSLTAKADAFNANAAFVSLRGRLILESPALAAPYAKIHAAYWEDYNNKRAKPVTPVAADTPVALPRRGSNSGSALFQSAIDQAEQDARDPSARLAREREANTRAAEARAAEQERARRSEQNARELREGLGQVLGVLAQSQQGSQARVLEQARQVQEQQRRSQGQPQIPSQSEMGVISDSPGDSPRPASTGADTSAWRVQQERDAAERNRRVKEADDELRRRNQAQIEATRKSHHPQNVGNGCVHVVVDQYNRQIFRNDCPWAVSISWPAGLWNIGRGGSYPTMQKGNFSFIACKYESNGAGLGPGNVCHD